MGTRLSDIAKLAGVSKATASRALADSPLVKQETRARIQAIAKQFGYVPNSLARAMATKRSGIIGICIYRKQLPYFAHTFFGPLLDGAIEEAKEFGYHIVVASTDQDFGTFDEHFIQDSIDGVILSTFTPMEAIQEFRKRRIPLVLANDVVQTPNNTYVVQDDYGGARAVMEHLISRGHRRIAFLTDRVSHLSYYLRYLAYLDALRDHGLSPYDNPRLPSPIDPWGNFARLDREAGKLALFGRAPQPVEGTPLVVHSTSPEVAAGAVRQMISTGDMPTAIFAAADSLALGALQALHGAGIAVPGEVAVAGFDDIALAKGAWPPLTTVKAGPFEMGRVAIRELMQRIENPELESRVAMVPTSLVIREST